MNKSPILALKLSLGTQNRGIYSYRIPKDKNPGSSTYSLGTRIYFQLADLIQIV